MSDVIANDQEQEDTAPEVETEAAEVESEEDEQEAGESGFDPDKAREKIRKVNSENRNLRKRAADAEAKAREAGENGEKVTALEADVLRLRVALKHGLPEELAGRLQGGSEEELLEDAEKLMGLFAVRKPPSNQPREKLRGGGDPTQEPSLIDSDPDKFAEQIFKN